MARWYRLGLRKGWLRRVVRAVLRVVGWVVSLPERHKQKTFWLLFFFGVLINTLDSFGLGEANQRLTASAIDAARGPVYGLQERRGQDAIKVILIGQDALDELGATGLPITYAQQRELLRKIDALDPRLIVFDVFYPKAQTSAELAVFDDMAATAPSELQLLADEMQRIGRKRPLIIGPVGPDATLQPLRDILVKDDAATDWTRGVHESALDVDPAAPREYVAKIAGASGVPLPTVAFAAYRSWCATSAVPCAQPTTNLGKNKMVVTWGYGVSKWRQRLVPPVCRKTGYRAVGDYLWRGFTRGVSVSTSSETAGSTKAVKPSERNEQSDAGKQTEANYGERCGYSDSIYYNQLDVKLPPIIDEDNKKELWPEIDFAKQIRGKIVVIGFDLPNFGDRRVVPFYDNVPGVFMHAMALDNLIEFKGKPFRAPIALFYGLDELDMVQYISSLVFLVVVWALRNHSRQLLLRRDTQRVREDVFRGTLALGLTIFIAFVLCYGWLRHWNFATVLLGGILPGGVLTISLLLLSAGLASRSR
ncbi:MAG: hypothetical protein CFE37_10085 [Alphaproteobacteria bacterium PA4]|nr:MAG: hypothetical protein CFE37_10085 [Alphaproteobacteria bacterium PA4]